MTKQEALRDLLSTKNIKTPGDIADRVSDLRNRILELQKRAMQLNMKIVSLQAPEVLGFSKLPVKVIGIYVCGNSDLLLPCKRYCDAGTCFRAAEFLKRDDVRKHIESMELECICGCNFNDGCLCKEARDGYNKAREEILKVIKR